MATDTETTMDIKLADGRSTGPMPLGALEKAAHQLSLPQFEGSEWPVVRLAFGGKYEHDLDLSAEGDQREFVEALSRMRIGESFRMVVTGELTAKTHQIKRDAESGLVSERVLIVKLAIDHAGAADDDPS